MKKPMPLRLFGLLVVAASACKDSSGPERGLPPGTLELIAGEVRALASSNLQSLRIAGGAGGSEFVLISLSASQTVSLPLQFSGEQLVPALGSPLARLTDPTPELSRSLTPMASDLMFESRLRQMEREELGPRIPGARARRQGGPHSMRTLSPRMEPLEVGAPVQLNTTTRSACDVPDIRSGKVVAVSQHAVIVADDANPVGGFSQADYAEIAAAFDSLVHPVVTQNFGIAGDVDNNGGRSLIFYTRAVNELSPISSSLIVGGFFFSRDLFPAAGSVPCAGSNEAEMFYMLVPDPAGEVNNNVRTTASVRRLTVGVLAHEYQHLINASRRIYVNDANEFEETWLNEGLSHVAEELLFYRASGLAPRQNITLELLRESQRRLDAVSAYQASNLGRLVEYLRDTENASPNAREDLLSTRGAAWQLLRYAADQSSTAERTLWLALANSRSSGIANLSGVMGVSFETLIRDWSAAQYSDDGAVPVGRSYTHPSWNYRSLLTALTPSPGYPLFTRSLAAPLSLTLRKGGTAYVRFGVAAGKVGAITATSGGAPPPATSSFVLIRTR